MSRVAIVKGEDAVEVAIRALEAIQQEAKAAVSGNKPILIKPNYIISTHPSTGITTDSRVIEGIVKFLKRNDVNAIVIGEGSGWADTLQA